MHFIPGLGRLRYENGTHSSEFFSALGNFHGQRSLVGYSLMGLCESAKSQAEHSRKYYKQCTFLELKK